VGEFHNSNQLRLHWSTLSSSAVTGQDSESYTQKLSKVFGSHSSCWESSYESTIAGKEGEVSLCMRARVQVCKLW